MLRECAASISFLNPSNTTYTRDHRRDNIREESSVKLAVTSLARVENNPLQSTIRTHAP